MKKFRVLSDLHVDLNDLEPLNIQDTAIFTILCGDTAGEVDTCVEWIRKNVQNGLVINGNHMPYNDSKMTMDELRDFYKKEFPIDSNVSYLDAEIGVVKKEVDGILFLGSCMYSNMKFPSPGNLSGDENLNKMVSYDKMNDYKYGITAKTYHFGIDNDPTYTKLTPADYVNYFNKAYLLLEEELIKNEKSENPLPVVLFTHYPLIKRIPESSGYVETYNRASYGSDMEDWILSHTSIKCYCCGHVHCLSMQDRVFNLTREDGSRCLVVNNARGYTYMCQDFNFTPEFYVNTKTWEVETGEINHDEQFKKLAAKVALYGFC